MQHIIRIGLLDSGTSPQLESWVLARSRFKLGHNGSVSQDAALPDPSGHGSAVARIIATLAPRARVLDAQVFDARGISAPMVVAAGLEWLIRYDAHVVNMSFGLIEDREVLRLACERALKAGVVLLAATPRRGRQVFPAAYSGVIRICADRRCGHNEISSLGGVPADFGACPFPFPRFEYVRNAGGASYAMAHATGIVGAWMSRQKSLSPDEVYRHLASVARDFTGSREAGPMATSK